MRPLPLLAAALLTFAGPAFAAATVDKVVVHGLDNELMRQNVELALSINNESGKRLGESRLEFLLREAQAEAREALEPFGYYSPEISVDAPRNGGDNDHLTVTLTIRLGDPVRIVVLKASLEERKIDFRLVEEKQAQGLPPRGQPARRPKRKY